MIATAARESLVQTDHAALNGGGCATEHSTAKMSRKKWIAFALTMSINAVFANVVSKYASLVPFTVYQVQTLRMEEKIARFKMRKRKR